MMLVAAMTDQTMNRRVLLQGIAASPMLGPEILSAGASLEINTPTGPQVKRLLQRRAELLAECDRLEHQWRSIWPTLPDWSRSGPKYVDANGEPFGERVGWPAAIENVIKVAKDRWLARPSPHDLRALYEKERIELSSAAAAENYQMRTRQLRRRMSLRRESYLAWGLPTSADWRLLDEEIEWIEGRLTSMS